MHLLTRPRHLAFTLTVFLLAGGTIGAVGLSNAEAAEPEGSFSFAAPKAGDEARYTITGGSPSRMGQYNLSWLPDEQVLLADGTRAWYNAVHVVENTANGKHTTDLVWYLAPGSLDAVASAALVSSTTVQDGTQMDMQQRYLRFEPHVGAIPCGLVAPWQGTTVAVAKQTFPGVSCWGAVRAMDAIGHYVTAGHIEETNTMVVEAHRGGLAMTFWYQSGIPYPVRIVEAGATEAVWTLEAYARGNADVRLQPDTPRAMGVPHLRTAPMPAWGIDSTGVDLPVSPQDAWQAALDDPSYETLRDYLATHPDAYVRGLSSGHFHDVDRGDVWHYWNFDVTDGDEWISLHARFITQDNDLVTPLDRPGTWDFSDRGIEDARGYSHPKPQAAPARMPTLASMLAIWEKHRGPDYQHTPGNAVRTWIRCGETCDEAIVQVTAGHDAYTRDHRTVAYVVNDYTDQYQASHVQWDTRAGSFILTRYVEHTQDWYAEGSTPPAPPVQASAMSLSRFDPGPMLSAREVAVAGAGALIAGLVYFLHPLLKTSFMGLFSRIKTPELLENPQRRRLMDHIEAEPGIHQQALVRSLGIGQGAVEHHLHKLHEGGLLTVHRSAGYTCYFPKATDRHVLAAAPVLKSAAAQQIIAHIRAHPGSLAVDVRNEIGISPSTMHYHLKRLSDAGVVRVQKAGNGTILQLGPAAA